MLEEPKWTCRSCNSKMEMDLFECRECAGSRDVSDDDAPMPSSSSGARASTGIELNTGPTVPQIPKRPRPPPVPVFSPGNLQPPPPPPVPIEEKMQNLRAKQKAIERGTKISDRTTDSSGVSSNATVPSQPIAPALDRVSSRAVGRPTAGTASSVHEPCVVNETVSQAEIDTNPSDPSSSFAVFSQIYKSRGWGSTSLSGSGSTPRNTILFRNFLNDFFKMYNIKSVFDAGCGHWPSSWQL